jgi:hypothetical protein
MNKNNPNDPDDPINLNLSRLSRLRFGMGNLSPFFYSLNQKMNISLEKINKIK